MSERVRLLPGYNPDQNPELFTDTSSAGLRKWLRAQRIDARRKPYNELANSQGLTISRVMDRLLVVAENISLRDSWKYDKSDRCRVFTPSFKVPGIDTAPGQLTRLHIALPAGFAPQPIIHIERTDPEVSPETFYEGQELVWNRGADEPPMFGMYVNREVGRAPIGSTYWDYAVKTLVAAHVEFCES